MEIPAKAPNQRFATVENAGGDPEKRGPAETDCLWLSSSHSPHALPFFFPLSTPILCLLSSCADASLHPDQRDSSHSLSRSGRLSLAFAKVNGRRRSLGKDGYCAWERSPQYPDFLDRTDPRFENTIRIDSRVGRRITKYFLFSFE